jgi:hypothetical protein
MAHPHPKKELASPKGHDKKGYDKKGHDKHGHKQGKHDKDEDSQAITAPKTRHGKQLKTKTVV